MTCIHCGRDSKYKDRSDGKCTYCAKRFAFEPKKGDRFTDRAFNTAIEAVSANGHIRWGVEHLYYELCRRVARRSLSLRRIFVRVVLFALLGLAAINLIMTAWAATLILLAVCVGIWRMTRRYSGPPTVRLSQYEFDGLWEKWIGAHGNPTGLIVRKAKPAPRRSQESDIGDYSFDRAVVCDRARTVDLLIANNFHFENNCAVLSIGGYPEGPFELVRTMLRRNPKLQVFALHDANAAGCQLAFKLANDEAWFKGRATVTDVGLRPRHAAPFRGLLLPPTGTAHAREGILASEVDWLGAYVLELAAIRPEQILKRLFKAINRREQSSADSASGDSGGIGGEVSSGGHHADAAGGFDVGGGGQSGGGGGGSGYDSDDSSFSAEAGDSDGGADSFG